jgi:hypothetical protein
VRELYEFVPVAGDGAAKGGLSHANGNCLMVAVSGDGYAVTDSKLGAASPRWQLSDAQFRTFGDFLVRLLTWPGEPGDQRTCDLGAGAVLTVRRTGDRNWAFSLTGEEDLVFTPGEYQAFTWGFFHGQFPPGRPVRRLRFRPLARRALNPA